MEFLYIWEPIRKTPGLTLKNVEIFLENGYMYTKSIRPVSYVVQTTMCGRLKQILEWK